MTKKLVLVNSRDEVIGFDTKERCHEGSGILHRAFSVYIFNDKKQLLIQKRSRFKKLWPLYWANSCCSHPRENESYINAGERRLKEEIGVECPLELVDKFQYQARYEDKGSEKEVCAVLTGEYNGKIRANLKEVDNWKWIDVDKLKKDIKKNPEKYTPWLRIGLGRYLKNKKEKLTAGAELTAVLEREAAAVNPVLEEILDNYVDKKFHDLVNYQVLTGGKRLRPALAIISCKLFRGKLKDVLLPAAGLEILHNYTLIVDDIIDHSDLRRNKPTTWFKFGTSIAECISIDYSAAIYEAANRSQNPVLISEIFSRTLKTIVDGEILDILFEQGGREEEPYIVKNRYHNPTEKEYYKMITKKTAALFESCCEVGGICANATKKQLKAVKNYGFNLGMAFQMQDDVLDIFGEEAEFGKKIGKDIEERKMGNIVILSAIDELSKADKKKMLKIIKKNRIAKKDVKEALKLIKKTKSCQKVGYLIKSFAEKAKKNLKILPQNKWNKALQTLADFVVQRQN